MTSCVYIFDPEEPPKNYSYLAQKQGTNFSVLTVHTDAERHLFSKSMLNKPSFSAKAGPIWNEAVKQWNHTADGVTVL